MLPQLEQAAAQVTARGHPSSCRVACLNSLPQTFAEPLLAAKPSRGNPNRELMH